MYRTAGGYVGEDRATYTPPVASSADGPVISVMLAVPDAPKAVAWYTEAFGAVTLWDLGSVVGLAVEGAPFFVGQPENNKWDSPSTIGTRTVRVEVFVDDPDAFIQRAVDAGADGATDPIRVHQMPWGPHRQGGFFDPFGHLWLVGDKSPLRPHPA
jgi:PhnB protein